MLNEIKQFQTIWVEGKPLCTNKNKITPKKVIQKFYTLVVPSLTKRRTALIDVASVAGLLTTTEAMITDRPDDCKSDAPAMPDMGGMPGMM